MEAGIELSDIKSAVLGSGVDIVEVERIRNSYEKFGERFLKRIFRPREMAYCFAHREPAPFLAARFAAKEAMSKAFGTGIGHQLGWLDLEVGRKMSGEPFAILHNGAYTLLCQRNAGAIHISLSHTTRLATAVAILEQIGNPSSPSR